MNDKPTVIESSQGTRTDNPLTTEAVGMAYSEQSRDNNSSTTSSKFDKAAEMAHYLETNFGKLDLNEDGQLSGGELKTVSRDKDFTAEDRKYAGEAFKNFTPLASMFDDESHDKHHHVIDGITKSDLQVVQRAVNGAGKDPFNERNHNLEGMGVAGGLAGGAIFSFAAIQGTAGTAAPLEPTVIFPAGVATGTALGYGAGILANRLIYGTESNFYAQKKEQVGKLDL